jgi:hypothetical protein
MSMPPLDVAPSCLANNEILSFIGTTCFILITMLLSVWLVLVVSLGGLLTLCWLFSDQEVFCYDFRLFVIIKLVLAFGTGEDNNNQQLYCLVSRVPVQI